MRENERLKNISKNLYLRSTNMTGRVKTHPKDYDGIDKDNPIIDKMDIGSDCMKDEWYFRVSFMGSGKWFSMPIRKDKIDSSFRTMKFVMEASIEDSIIDDIEIDEEEATGEIPF